MIVDDPEDAEEKPWRATDLLKLFPKLKQAFKAPIIRKPRSLTGVLETKTDDGDEVVGILLRIDFIAESNRGVGIVYETAGSVYMDDQIKTLSMKNFIWNAELLTLSRLDENGNLRIYPVKEKADFYKLVA